MLLYAVLFRFKDQTTVHEFKVKNLQLKLQSKIKFIVYGDWGWWVQM